MAKNIGTFRTKTRHKMSKSPKQKGKISLTKFFQKFVVGDRVHLVVEPAVQKGMYHPRFMGRTGEVKEVKGNCYGVEIIDGKKKKTLVVHPVHLKKAQ